MRLWFRHLRRSILRAPWQTLVLLFTVFCSALLFACIPPIYSTTATEREVLERLPVGNADLEIAPVGEGAGRYLTPGELVAGLGDTPAHIAGYMILPMTDSVGSLAGAATDIYTVGEVFELAFLSYEEPNAANLNDTVFVSASFAALRGVSVGDSLTLSLLGEEKTYTVRGVNQTLFFGSYEVLLHAEGALDTLAAISPVFSVFDGENLPYNYLYCRLTSGADPVAVAERLNAVLGATGWQARDCRLGELQFYDQMVFLMLTAVLLCSVVIAGIMVFFTLRIMGEQRVREGRVFLHAGMSPRALFGALCIEVLCYLLVGTSAGVAAAPALLRVIGGSFAHAELHLTVGSVAASVIGELAVGAVALGLYARGPAEGKGAHKTHTGRVLILLGAGLALSFAGALLLPLKLTLVFAPLSFFFWLALVLYGMFPLARGISRLPERLGGKLPPALTLAAKNNAGGREICNVYRILCSMLSVSILLSAGALCCRGRITGAEETLACEYIVLGAGSDGAARAEALEGTAFTTPAFFTTGHFAGGQSIALFDCENYEALSGERRPAVRPVGNEIYLTGAVAACNGVAPGDAVRLTVMGVEREFCLAGYVDETSAFAYISAADLGFTPNILLIKAQNDADGAYLKALGETLSFSGALIETPAEMLRTKLHFVEIIAELLEKYVCFVVLIVAVGSANLIFISYARRRAQFRAFVTVGMTRGGVARMIAAEALLTLLLVTLLVAASSGVLCLLMDAAMQVFGFRLFL